MGNWATEAGKSPRMAARSMSSHRIGEMELLAMFVMRLVASPKLCSVLARFVMSCAVGDIKIAASSA